jgi:hypothetical protein
MRPFGLDRRLEIFAIGSAPRMHNCAKANWTKPGGLGSSGDSDLGR